MKTLKLLLITSIIFSTFNACSSDDENKEENEEEQKITLAGNYLGTWNSTTDMDITYTNFGISAKLNFTNSTQDQLSGEFFATSTYTSCCNSGDNDGSIVMNLDGDTVTSFSFNDVITDCSGSFTGTGSITSNNPFKIEIDFIGNDCDGNHIGKMVFTRASN